MTETTISKPLISNDFKQIMFGRKSVRQFEKGFKIDQSELQEMLKEAASAPSACDLQAWHFVVCNSEDGRAKAKSLMMPFNYPQVDSCSAMIFVMGDTKSFESYRDLWNQAYKDGNITAEKRDEVLNTFLPLYEKASQQFLIQDASVDSAMAAMQLLLIARAHGYEANPIGGYAVDKVATTFGLNPEQYVPVMAIAIGKAAETPIESVRYDVTEQTQFI